MVTVLLAGGFLIHERFEAQLSTTIDQGLRTRADDVTALVRRSRGGLGAGSTDPLTGAGESAAQVLTSAGNVFQTTPQLGPEPLLTPAEAAGASDGPTYLIHSQVRSLEGSARILAAPIETRGRRLLVVVASSLGERGEALTSLTAILLIGGPLALLISSLASFGAVTAALRPVEAMRRRAADISTAEPDHRLPVSPAPDELRRLGETLNEMLGRIQETLEHERAFVDDASHELRTPLALHRTELELALRYAEDPDQLRAAISSAIVEADRLSSLAEDLLALARSDQRALELDREELDTRTLLAAVATRFEGSADETDRRLVVEDGPGLDLIGDRRRLEQALGNLVANALGHGAGDVTLRATTSAGRVRMEVTDFGEGPEAAFLPHAFERFTRADAARSTPGTGLGLPIVAAVAQAHGGAAGLETLPGGGTAAWIEIPGAGA